MGLTGGGDFSCRLGLSRLESERNQNIYSSVTLSFQEETVPTTFPLTLKPCGETVYLSLTDVYFSFSLLFISVPSSPLPLPPIFSFPPFPFVFPTATGIHPGWGSGTKDVEKESRRGLRKHQRGGLPRVKTNSFKRNPKTVNVGVSELLVSLPRH